MSFIAYLKELLGDYFYVIIIGIFGGILGLERKEIRRLKGINRLIANISATLSSAFVCAVAFSIVKYTTNNTEVALGIGGFCAWQGAEWTKNTINRFLNKKIDNSEFRGYSYFESNEELKDEISKE